MEINREFMRENGLKNNPTNTNGVWFYVIHIASQNNNYQKQIALSFNNESTIYSRTKDNGTWQSWTKK